MMNVAMTRYRGRPLAFLLHYVRRHPVGHAVVLTSVVLAVVCAVCTQYGVKALIDAVSRGPSAAGHSAWWALAVLCALIASDNLFWRLGGWTAASIFVRVTGDVRSDLFLHLVGHAP